MSGERHRRAGRAVHVLASVVLLAIGLLALVAGVLPRLVGGGAYAVETASMRPQLPPGTLVVVRPVDPSTLGIGDVVTYQLRSGEPTVVTHRIVGIEIGRDGGPRFTTQGDANPSPDPAPVQALQVRGRLWYAVPELGRLTLALGDLDRVLVSRLVAGGLALVALHEFLGAARERRRHPSNDHRHRHDHRGVRHA